MIRFYASSFANILYSSKMFMTYNTDYTARWYYIQGISEENIDI